MQALDKLSQTIYGEPPHPANYLGGPDAPIIARANDMIVSLRAQLAASEANATKWRNVAEGQECDYGPLQAEVAQLRAALSGLLDYAQPPQWAGGNCRLCDELGDSHAPGCAFGEAVKKAQAALKVGE